MTREEAIFYIKELQKTYASMDTKVAEAIDMAIEALSTERTEWIPVSERLPDTPEQVLVTVLWHEPYDNYEVTLGEYWDNGEAWGDWKDGEITAWMPLPDAYKGGDTE